MAIVAGVFYLYSVQKQSHVALNPDNFCPATTLPVEMTALVIDATDSLNRVQQSSVRNIIEKLVSNTPRHGALAIYLVSTDPEVQSEPVFFRCNPGRGDEIDPIFGNPQKVEYLWKTGFQEVLDEQLTRTLESEGANSSPIMESVLWAAIQHFDKDGYSDIPRNLVVISDFLQHTNGYSHYRSQPNFAVFERSQYYRKIQSDLEDVNVHLWQIRRNSRHQNADLEKFWEVFFRAQGAVGVTYSHLPG